MRSDCDSGIPGGSELLEFAEALIGRERHRLDTARKTLQERLDPATVTAASAIAGNFSKNDRIADATGIPIDPSDLDTTIEMRDQLGLNNFKSAANTFRYFTQSAG